MSKHKNQHYIPQTYLKAWVDPETPEKYEPYVWRVDKEEHEPKRKAPSNIFHENNMYTIYDENGNRDLRLEHGLSSLESLFTDLREETLSEKKKLTPNEYFLMCAFIAAMYARTKVQRNQLREMWNPALEKMQQWKKHLENASEEEIENLKKMPRLGPQKEGLSIKQVEKLVAEPIKEMLETMISSLAPMLAKLDCIIFTTNHEIGFLTSDAPCVWSDPEAYKRPPFYQAPALMWESIEITFPISPNLCVLLNRQSLNGYRPANKFQLSEINRRTIRRCGEYYVSNKENIDKSWLN